MYMSILNNFMLNPECSRQLSFNEYFSLVNDNILDNLEIEGDLIESSKVNLNVEEKIKNEEKEIKEINKDEINEEIKNIDKKIIESDRETNEYLIRKKGLENKLNELISNIKEDVNNIKDLKIDENNNNNKEIKENTKNKDEDEKKKNMIKLLITSLGLIVIVIIGILFLEINKKK